VGSEKQTGSLRRADELHLAGHYAPAVEEYRRALAGDDSLLAAWYGLGCASLKQRAYGEAATALRRAVLLCPDAHGARCSLAEALFQLGEVDGAVAEYQFAASSADPKIRAVALAGIALIAPGAAACDNRAILAARRNWVDSQGYAARVERPRSSSEKLRIGYLSRFFGAPNWMKFVWGVINYHDRDKFEIHLISDGDDPSAESGYIDHADDRIWQVAGLPNEQLARHVADAGLDVLIDLNGYSDQSRLLLFRHRPARLQISWMGMYGTTGVPETDYLVGDAAVIPPEEEQFYCEPVVRVPGSYLAFRVSYPVPEVAPPPCLATRHVTFGCLSSAYKLSEPTVAAFARILHGSPASRMLLCNRTLADASNRAALLERFGRHGIGAERLTLEGGAAHFDFLRNYDRVDIALDTFPYNGGTTTAEALWQGVPMLSFNGDRWASRTSRSLLLAGGLDEFVAADQAGVEAAAIALANAADIPGRLAALRATMRDRLCVSAACDVAGLCRALEALYRNGVRANKANASRS
jgi:predicted O-linked N-acetylglucosamine transferase (SPINDLY family)